MKHEHSIAHSLTHPHLPPLSPHAQLERLGILKSSNIAPSLQAKQEELRKAQLEDQLNAGIEKRPTREQLEAKGILKGGEE